MKKRFTFEGKVIVVLCGIFVFYGLVKYFEGINHNINEDNIDSHDDKEEWWKLSPLWVEDQRPQVNPHKFGYLSNNPDLCKESGQVSLLVMVTSAVMHRDRRDAIRQTWGSDLDRFDAKMVFLLGQGRDHQTLVLSENEYHKDIIQEDFEDTYHNLTLKTVMGLKWTSIFCPQVKFVLKTDDDIYVNVALVHDAITDESVTLSQNIHGCIKNSRLNSPAPIPMSDSPESISLMRPALPEFTAGAGYLLPGQIVPDLYLASLSTKLMPVEDAFTTGYCAKKIGLHPPKNDARFSCGQLVNQDCDMLRKFTGHKVTPERMFTIWEKLHNKVCQ